MTEISQFIADYTNTVSVKLAGLIEAALVANSCRGKPTLYGILTIDRDGGWDISRHIVFADGHEVTCTVKFRISD